MEANLELRTEKSTDCGCCHLSSDTVDGSYGCTDRSTVFTVREQEVLARIRAASDRAREIKRNFRQAALEGRTELAAGAGSLEELENLRKVRMVLEEERLAAAEERMLLLGYN